jgi:hypothetical protein
MDVLLYFLLVSSFEIFRLKKVPCICVAHGLAWSETHWWLLQWNGWEVGDGWMKEAVERWCITSYYNEILEAEQFSKGKRFL